MTSLDPRATGDFYVMSWLALIAHEVSDDALMRPLYALSGLLLAGAGFLLSRKGGRP